MTRCNLGILHTIISYYQRMSNAEDASSTSTTTSTTIRSGGLKKRPRPSSADAIARLQESGSVTLKGGRGSRVGYTSCPLCGTYSRKQHVVGRGLAAHLLAVHTPWNPTKLTQKIHRRLWEAQERERQTKQRLLLRQQQQQQQEVEKNHPPDDDDDAERKEDEKEVPVSIPAATVLEDLKAYTPTSEQMRDWDEQVLNICRQDEQTHTHVNAMIIKNVDHNETKHATNHKEGEVITQPVDTTTTTTIGELTSYRGSLPPLLAAASRGDLSELQRLVQQAEQEDTLTLLLETRDRHGSVAEHWAAGGGHLSCLAYLLQMKQQQQLLPQSQQQERPRKKPRRRDGKTCLHYAARNGHVDCIRYLLEGTTKSKTSTTKTHQYSIDERSGEGTTPLHMACYGGHVDAVRYLHAIQRADILATNDWECSAAHWVGMTIQDQDNHVRELCNYLQQQGVVFTKAQSQGHSALHKAAQRKNRHVVEWMGNSKEKGGAGLSRAEKEACGRPDRGGHIPSDIWKSVGGDVEFAEWMKTMGW